MQRHTEWQEVKGKNLDVVDQSWNYRSTVGLLSHDSYTIAQRLRLGTSQPSDFYKICCSDRTISRDQKSVQKKLV